MWPFNRYRTGGVVAQQGERDWRAVLAAELEAKMPVGTEFEYMGRECVVTHHCYFNGIDVQVGMRARYADNNGVIREITFNPSNTKWLLRNRETTA